MVALNQIGTVHAAGGVVWRASPDGELEVCLVHRPRYDDWSLPKGKLGPGEHPLAGAVREVEEETAVRAAPRFRLRPARYRLRDGTPKLVQFYAMRAVHSPRFRSSQEVDRLMWAEPGQAMNVLSYRPESRILRQFLRLPPISGAVVLVRHAHAGSRGAWPGPDGDRPLDARGRAQADGLAPLLSTFAPQRLVSASPRRCVQTLQPLARALDLPVEVEPVFDETTAAPEEAAARLVTLARERECTVVCSQGKVIPPALPVLTERGTAKSFDTPKGGGWLLSFSGDRPIGAVRLGVPPTRA